MRYAIFSARFAPLVGGVEKFTERISYELLKEQNEVIVVTCAINQSAGLTVDSSGLEILRLPCRSFINNRFLWPKKNQQYKKLLEDLAQSSIDRILVNTRFYPHSLEGLSLAKRLGVTPVLLDHGSAHLVLGKSRIVDWVIERYEHGITNRAMRYQPAFYGISERSSEWLNHFGITSCGVIPNAIDCDAFVNLASKRSFRRELQIKDAFLVVFVGRLAPEKGPDRLVSVAKRFSSDNMQFVLVGEGPLMASLSADKPDNVHLVGRLDSADVSALLQEANAFVLPTRSEGFCTALLEASSCSLPSVITDVGGARELIPDSHHGIIIPNETEDEIEAGLRKLLLAGNAECRLIGRNARAVVEGQFNWSNTASCLKRAFEKIELT